MAKVDANLFPKVILVEAAAPATPAAGTVIEYAKVDGLIYSKDDAGVETLVSGGAAGGAAAFAGAKAYATATQALTASAVTPITFAFEEYDSDAYHSTVTDTSRFTIPAGKAGKYLLQGGTVFSGTPAVPEIGFRLNGTTLIRGSGPVSATASARFAQCSTVAELAAGDYVELWAYTTTSSITVGNGSGATDAESWAAVTKIA